MSVGDHMRKALVLLTIITFPLYSQVVNSEGHKWIDSYKDFTKHIRPQDADGIKNCEIQLKDILNGIDEGSYCEANSECALIGEDPFGSTVPINKDSVEGVQNKMTVFKASCDNDLSISIKNSDLINQSRCLKNKCMVVTSIK